MDEDSRRIGRTRSVQSRRRRRRRPSGSSEQLRTGEEEVVALRRVGHNRTPAPGRRTVLREPLRVHVAVRRMRVRPALVVEHLVPVVPEPQVVPELMREDPAPQNRWCDAERFAADRGDDRRRADRPLRLRGRTGRRFAGVAGNPRGRPFWPQPAGCSGWRRSHAGVNAWRSTAAVRCCGSRLTRAPYGCGCPRGPTNAEALE